MYLTWGEPPQAAAAKIDQVRKLAQARGRNVRFGIRLHTISRDTSAAAWAVANELVGELTEEQVAKATALHANSESEGQRRMTALHGGRVDRAGDLPQSLGGRRPGARRRGHRAGGQPRRGRQPDLRVPLGRFRRVHPLGLPASRGGVLVRRGRAAACSSRRALRSPPRVRPASRRQNAAHSPRFDRGSSTGCLPRGMVRRTVCGVVGHHPRRVDGVRRSPVARDRHDRVLRRRHGGGGDRRRQDRDWMDTYATTLSSGVLAIMALARWRSRRSPSSTPDVAAAAGLGETGVSADQSRPDADVGAGLRADRGARLAAANVPETRDWTNWVIPIVVIVGAVGMTQTYPARVRARVQPAG